MTAVTPTAIDAMVPIDSVQIIDRHRTDLGDVEALAKSRAVASTDTPQHPHHVPVFRRDRPSVMWRGQRTRPSALRGVRGSGPHPSP